MLYVVISRCVLAMQNVGNLKSGEMCERKTSDLEVTFKSHAKPVSSIAIYCLAKSHSIRDWLQK